MLAHPSNNDDSSPPQTLARPHVHHHSRWPRDPLRSSRPPAFPRQVRRFHPLGLDDLLAPLHPPPLVAFSHRRSRCLHSRHRRRVPQALPLSRTRRLPPHPPRHPPPRPLLLPLGPPRLLARHLPRRTPG